MTELILGDDYEIKSDEPQLMDQTGGAQSNEDIEDSLLHSVTSEDKKTYDQGELLAESFNQGIGTFNPDIMFESIVNNFSMAKKVYGETLIRLISGYNPSYIERNIRIPEFKRELKKKIADAIDELSEEKLLDRDKSVSDKGLTLASLTMYIDELDRITPKGNFGEHVHKKPAHYGERGESRAYRAGDRYKDISVKESLKLAVRRRHSSITIDDLRTSQRQSVGQTQIIYAIDASGSMKGKKIEKCKKAGIALAYKAIEARDKVGLIVFGSDVKEEIAPTDDFRKLLLEITQIRASRQTDFKGMLHKSLELFPSGDFTKHLVILTDALPTVGEDPEKESIREISRIHDAGITVSVIGISLDDNAVEFAQNMVEVGEGRLYLVHETDEIDTIVLEDYYSVR